MTKTALITVVEIPKKFMDVLYLTNQGQIPPEIKLLFKQRKLSSLLLPIDNFFQVRNRLDLIGTVIIDSRDLDVLQQQRLARIIESFEAKSIGIILLNNRIKSPVKSFSLAPVKSFSLTTMMESVSTDELWGTISINLACRKKTSDIAVKPAVPSALIHNNHSRVAEQLRMAGTLVDNLAEQLHMAGLVQRDFLPAQLPNTNEVQWASAFIPAEWVSGDIYDIARIDEHHIGFYVADVVGHGMPAALLTIFLKQALVMRQTIDNNYRIFSPVEVMSNLNMRMVEQKFSGHQFVTCCYCLLNVKTLQLTYARAGHPCPILIREHQQPQQLQIQGSLLGIFEQPEYAQQTIQLHSGDKLLLYSDGAEHFIADFNDQSGFSFNEQFCKIRDLPIVEMMDKLNNVAKNNTTDPLEVDDITIVGLEIL